MLVALSNWLVGKLRCVYDSLLNTNLIKVTKMTYKQKIGEEVMDIMLGIVKGQCIRGDFTYLSKKFKQDFDKLIIQRA